MIKLIMPALLIIAAVGLFVMYTNPTYQGSKALEAKVAAYDDALNKSNQLRKLREQLLSKRNTFSTEDVGKLQRILPDNVDNIRLIIDINNMAAQHNLSLTNVQLGEVSGASKSESAVAVGTSGEATGSVELGFAVAASYEDFLAFVQNLEHSLRLIDVEKLSFKAGEKGTGPYVFTIRTYWLH